MPDWHSCETGSIRCLLMFCLRWHAEQHRLTRAFFSFAIDIVCLFSHPPSFAQKCQKIHLICEMIVKPKIIANKTEDVLNVSFFFLSPTGRVVSIVFEQQWHTQWFQNPEVYFQDGGATQRPWFIKRRKRVQEGKSLLKENYQEQQHIWASTSLWGYH